MTHVWKKQILNNNKRWRKKCRLILHYSHAGPTDVCDVRRKKVCLIMRRVFVLSECKNISLVILSQRRCKNARSGPYNNVVQGI